MLPEPGLAGLFLSSFLASTLLPGGSEAVLLWMAHQAAAPAFSLLLVATTGNTLGGMTSWGIGFWLQGRFSHRERLQAKQQRALQRLEKHGAPLLLLSWLPLIGDPLCLAAGWLKISPLLAALFIALGKASRYAVLLWLTSS